jgi:hypothetical protein
MKIVEVETDDIGTIKSIVEILNGTVPEANADFIRDALAFNKSLDKSRNNSSQNHNDDDDDDNDEDDDDSDDDVDSDDNNEYDDDESEEIKSVKNKLKTTKNTVPKASIVAKKNNTKKIVKEPVKPVKPIKGNKKQLTEKKSQVVSTGRGKKIPAVKGKGKNSNFDEESDDEIKSSKSKKSVKGKEIVKHNKKINNEEENNNETNRGQIKILTADPNQVMIIYIVLNGSAFKTFVVHPEKYSVGLNLDELYKYIKNVDKEGTMSIHIDSDDTQHIVFDVKSANSATNESICELRVVNLPTRNDRKIEVNVTMAVRINCQQFHKACKDLMQFSQFVEITCDPSQLAITCKGDLSNHKRIFKADGTQDGVMIKTVKRDTDENDVPDIIRLVFDLKYINSMYKCSSLCDDMEIYLNSESIMFLKYGIKLMGEMMVGISPSRKKKENIDNYDENIDAYYRDDDEIQLK